MHPLEDFVKVTLFAINKKNKFLVNLCLTFHNWSPYIMYLGYSRDTYKPLDLLLYISDLIGDNDFIKDCYLLDLLCSYLKD